MLNVLAEIGKTAAGLGGGDVLEFLVPEKNSFKVIVGVNFDTEKGIVEFRMKQTGSEDGLSKSQLEENLYIPAEKGAKPQFMLTTPNLSYLLSQSIPNLFSFLPENDLKEKLGQILDCFFVETRKPKDMRYGRVISPKLLNDVEASLDLESPNPKDSIAAYAAELEKAIAEKMHAKPKEMLYTVLIDGVPVADNKEYREFVLYKNLESAFESVYSQTCTTCGKTTDVTTDTTRFQFKFYMTDKINFASYFDGNNYHKAVSLCRDCYRDTLVGERWVDANLKTTLGQFQVYILPQILYSTFEYEDIIDKLGKLTDMFNSSKNVAEIRKRENDIRLYYQDVPFIFNFLFYKKAQSAFKILTLIKDVPPSRLAQMAKVTSEADKIAAKHEFPPNCRFDLNRIYWLMPLKKKGADHHEYRKLLQIYDHLFNAYPLQSQALYSLYTQLAHMHHAGTYGLYQFSQPQNSEWQLQNDTLLWNLFLLFLKEQNLFTGGDYMEATQLKEFFPNGLAELFADLKYDPAQQGLALLGYVLGAVANAQRKEGLENKPVMEKVNYQGMSEEKVLRLFNDLFEKIRQYRRHIGYAERWWAAAKQLYESADKSRLTANERVFYLLSGYSFNLLGSRKQDESEETETEKNNE